MTRVNIIRAKYTGGGIVIRLKQLLGTNESINNEDFENYPCYNSNEINIIAFDYTPVISGDVYIKYPNKVWEKLRLNSKIINKIKKNIVIRTPHISNKSNIIMSIRSSELNFIEL